MEKFSDGEKDETDWEEIIVYANFEAGTIDKEIFQQSDLKFKIIGLDSDTPVVQLGDSTYKGVWNDTIGTKVFFEEDTSPADPVDPVFTVQPQKMMKYKCMSTKSLDLSRIFLRAKNSEDTLQSDSNKMLDDFETDLSKEDNDDILELVQNTIVPNANTSDLMNDIVKLSTSEILEDNIESDENR